MRRLLFLLGLALLPGLAEACTTVAFTDPARAVLAYNFDFHIGQGVVLINKRGLDKTSETKGDPARWRARYASITFNMFGRDSPMTGMNEAGLAASQMWLDEARYEAADGRPTIGVVEWLQYVLDTSASVDEALANISKLRIESRIPLHYKLMDASGHAAVVEFLDGEAVIRSGEALPHAALANDTYVRSLEFAADTAAGPAQATGSGSLARFTRAALAQRSLRDGDPIAFAFATLADVAQPQRTQWSIVYDTARRTVHWQTRVNKLARSAGFAGLDLTCAAPTMLLGIDEGAGDVGLRFRPYRSEDNERLLVETVKATPFLSGIDDAALHESALWPETSICQIK
ncbi:linear amide C-N hydrolase [Taklimakanibacter deserti]|uniref:linear amide C-N hydrolase n=1 Tax=Taklimakanibacter deserti TaxID=2267839 RepID=UPI0013C42170